MKQRLLSFGNSTIGLSYDQGRPAELIHFLFGRIPEPASGEPWTNLQLEDGAGDGGLRLRRDGKLINQNLPYGRMADHLMAEVCYSLAHESRGGLLLHSAAVRNKGRGIILPGKSGAGKSTLTAWLASNDCDYSTDEMIFVPNGSRQFAGFTRPIVIKSPARHLLPTLVKERWLGSVVIEEPAEMVYPERLGAAIVADMIPLDLIVFPHYQDGREMAIGRLSKAEAAFELMRCLANARNLAEHGLSEVVRLANTVPAYALSYANLGQAGRAILDLLP